MKTFLAVLACLSRLSFCLAFAAGGAVASAFAQSYLSELNLAEIKQKADQSDVDAQYQLLEEYCKVGNVDQDVMEAEKLLRRAPGQKYATVPAIKNDTPALYDLLNIDNLKQKAKQGYAGAQYELGARYFDGEDIKHDSKLAMQWWCLAAKQGHAEALYSIGNMYYRYGIEVVKDAEKASLFFGVAAQQGHVEAASDLGHMYRKGEGVGQDSKKAVEWLHIAAEQGHLHAQIELADMYLMGEGVEKDSTKALKWLGDAANQGHIVANYKIGQIYERGWDISQNHKEAIENYGIAAKQGHLYSQYEIGVMYLNGKGVAQDYSESYIWFALLKNNIASEFNFTQGTSKDDFMKEVFEKLQKAKTNLTPIQIKNAQKEAERRSEKIKKWQASGAIAPRLFLQRAQ